MENDFQIVQAGLPDLPSLCTILARSFHPVNPHVKSVIPDTPKVREWWKTIYSRMMQDPHFRILVATPTSPRPAGAEDEYDRSVVGILILHFVQPGDPTPDVWTSIPITPDHNREKWDAMVGASDDSAEKIMGGKDFYTVENLGTDHDWKGKGVGTALLAKACEAADQRGVEMYVVANAKAVSFYTRHGFEGREEIVIPGDVPYSQCKLVRPVQSGKS